MKVKELMESLAEADPEAEVITDVWNGRVSTFTILDSIANVKYDWIKKNILETSGAYDKHFHDVKSENLFYIGSTFTNADFSFTFDHPLNFRIFVNLVSN